MDILCKLDDYFSLGSGRLDTLKSLVCGIISSGSVNLKEVCARFEHGLYDSNYRKVQYFFQKQRLDDIELIRFIIGSLFSDDEIVTLAIDRTDWSYGKTRHNLLILSVLYRDTAIPLLILPLERKGNSNHEQRIYLLDCLLSALPAKRVKALLGDREFIGEEWFKAMQERNMPFVMRLKDNMHITMQNDDRSQSVTGKISEICTSDKPTNYGDVIIGGNKLQLATCKSNGDIVALASYKVDNPLEIYKQRWAIEVGFKCLKTNGFNLEDTHITHAYRIKTLVQICAIAMTISFIKLAENNLKIPVVKKNTDSKL